jgi:hypothetical protein
VACFLWTLKRSTMDEPCLNAEADRLAARTDNIAEQYGSLFE